MPIFDPASVQRYAQTYATPAAQASPQASVGRSAQGEAAWPYWLLAAGQGADIASTVAATRNPNLKEANPMGVGGTVAAKAAMGAALAWLMHHEHAQGNDKAQKLIGTIGALSGFGPAAWNLSQMQKAQ